MTDIAIRKATSADYYQVFGLMKEFALFQKTPGKLQTSVAQMHEDAGSFQCMVAEDSCLAIVAFATFFPAYYSWTGKGYYIDDLYVSADYRKQGIGKQLLLSVIDEARKAGCKKVRWQVSGWNKEAIAFYKSMGASVDDIEINCDLWL